ncbi:MAG TPA: cobalamin-independent methionine synthase II family protein [Bryobacteraceae bacterium]|nr:cobalamin-independent methionine synthase II family protein [Bryobacteraceae bacterium]
MQRSADRILTTHCGSLARPAELLDVMKAKVNGEPYDADLFAVRLRDAVAAVVHKQAENGIDVVNDGEQSKSGFFTYVGERLNGFEPVDGPTPRNWAEEVDEFPEYYEQYFSRAMMGRTIAKRVAIVCTGPISYRGQDGIRRDIENLKAALKGLQPADVFMPAVAPSGVGENRYYRTDEEYWNALADAMHHEYKAIVDAGFLVQIDDPFLTDNFSYSSAAKGDARKTAEAYVEAVNRGLRGIPPEKVRYHTCYGINEGPRVHDVALGEVVPYMLKVNAGAYSFEAANARHEHEYHIWENMKLPEGKVLIPGVVTHASNIVEHPELIAERIVRYAKRVGRENVIAGTDCGFSSQATYTPEVHPKVVWAKFRAMAEGARLATKQLWG